MSTSLNQRGTMNALVLHAVGDARYERTTKPTAGPKCVIVRVAACGVCGSDIPRMFVKGTYSFPTICGHEFAGVIDSCGEGVEGWAVGDRVAVFPLIWCGCCAACEEGQYAQCSDYDYLGSRSDGGMAEYVAVPVQNLIRIPVGVSLEDAAMTEPAAVALHSLRRTGDQLIGKSVAVFGAGPIGLMVAQWARIMGASRIVLADVVPQKVQLARTLGFEDVIDSATVSVVDAIQELTSGVGVNVCVDAAGVPETMLAAFRVVSRDGSVIWLGNPFADVTLPASLISSAMRKEINIYGTWNSCYRPTGDWDDWHIVLDTLAARKIDLASLISHRVSLSDSFDILRKMKEGSEYFCKVLVYPNENGRINP